MPKVIPGKNADYVITYFAGLVGSGHSTSDRGFLSQSPDAIVSELPEPFPNQDILNPRYPSTEEAIWVLRNAGWYEIQRVQIPVVVLDPRILPWEKFHELVKAEEHRVTVAKTGRWSATVLAMAAVALAARQMQLDRKEKKSGAQESPPKLLNRREFLRKNARGLIAGGLVLASAGLFGGMELYEPLFLNRTGPLKSTWIQEGRSAWIIDRCENNLAPFLQKSLPRGKKPRIALIVGNMHSEVEQYIQDPTERQRILKKFDKEFKLVPPKFRDSMFLFRIDSVGRVSREVIPISSAASRPVAIRPPQKLSRRELFDKIRGPVRRSLRAAGIRKA